MPKKSASVAKRVIAVRLDLLPLLYQLAAELKQNPNQLANLLMEGGINAMLAEDTQEIPIVQLYRTLKGKTLLTSKAVMSICSVVVPDIHEIERHQQRILLDLINRHDGPLTADILKGYQKIAAQMNKERIKNEREVAKLQRIQKAR